MRASCASVSCSAHLEALQLGVDLVGGDAALVNLDAAREHVRDADRDPRGSAHPELSMSAFVFLPCPARTGSTPSPKPVAHQLRQRSHRRLRVVPLADDGHRHAVRRHQRQQAHDALAVGLLSRP